MRICRFSTGEEPRFGVVTGEVDQFGQPADDSVVVALAGDPLYVGVKVLEEQHRLSDVRLLAPIIPRSKVVGIGRNYAAHAAELGNDVPSEPLMFLKPNTTVVGPGDPIYYPPQTSDLHYEGELAVVIGRGGRAIGRERAMEHVAGYAVFNDASVRDWQRHSSQFTPGKNFPATGGFGPALVMPDAIGELGAQRVQTRLNGTLMQDQPVSDLIFDVPALIEYLSAFTALSPGDVIVTGTPGGVGDGRDPPVYLQAGDVVEVSIGTIGTLRNPVVAEA